MRDSALAVLFLLSAAVLSAQPAPAVSGEAVFASNCAGCHGMNGSGGRGPNLRGQLRHGDENADIAKVVRGGVPGTGMPSFDMDPKDLNAVVNYIQTLRRGGPATAPPPGDAAAGKRVYDANGCAGCHEIAGKGSTFGPNLTRVGAGRSHEYLKESVLHPSADIPDSFVGVTVVDRNGKRYQGIAVNEDSFTLQLRLPNQEFLSFDKQQVQSLIHEKKSLMPAYTLADGDLTNLLSYLSSLTGSSASTEIEQRKRAR